MEATTLSYLDAYCERAGEAGLWAEPVNAITNLAFLFAAWLAYRRFSAASGLNLKAHWDIAILILLLAAIGMGSGLWHTLASAWAMLGDVIPILLFINLYLVSFLARILQLRWYWVVFCWLLFQGAGFAFEFTFSRETLNGTIMYVPTYLTLLVMTAWLAWQQHPQIRSFLAVIGIWSISLIFRTIDISVCQGIAVGTHFLWHILNAFVLYLLLQALMKSAGRGNASPA